MDEDIKYAFCAPLSFVFGTRLFAICVKSLCNTVDIRFHDIRGNFKFGNKVSAMRKVEKLGYKKVEQIECLVPYRKFSHFNRKKWCGPRYNTVKVQYILATAVIWIKFESGSQSEHIVIGNKCSSPKLKFGTQKAVRLEVQIFFQKCRVLFCIF